MNTIIVWGVVIAVVASVIALYKSHSAVTTANVIAELKKAESAAASAIQTASGK
jgi:hypothetical protein